MDAPAAVSRAISLVENESEGFMDLLAAIQPGLGRAHRVGVTGPPGAGKSTLVQALTRAWRAAGRTVAVVAVDPTSPLSGGALLGDRVRMEGVAMDPGVFIRSMATRGARGGLALATREVCDVLDAAGYDLVVVETVGVGQAELDVVAATDTAVLVLVPESGDGIQTLKAGLMELADLFVVNKADRPDADRLAREIETALSLRAAPPGPSAWTSPVLRVVATTAAGIDGLAEAVAGHRAWLEGSGTLPERRRARQAEQLERVVRRAVERWAWRAGEAADAIARHREAVEAGATTPYQVAAEVVRKLER